MASLSDYPTFDEWLAALQTNPELVEHHAQQLRWQAMAQGPGDAEPILLLSIQDYERAHAQLGSMPARHLPEASAGAAASAPESAPPAYPDLQQWQALIAADAGAAWRQCAALELQAARYGPFNTPPTLGASIQAYKTAKSNLASADLPEPPQPEQPQAAELAPADEPAAEPATDDQPWWKRLLGR